MYIPFVGLCIGAIIGLLFPTHIPVEYSQYVAVAILASLDSVLGGINAKLKALIKKKFLYPDFYKCGFCGIADLYRKEIGFRFVSCGYCSFGTRLFQNIAEIRRYMLKNNKKKDRIEEANN
jgi:small basic protein